MVALNQQALDQLFYTARTHNGWLPKSVDDTLLQQVYDAMKWGPTSANCSPARIVFVKSDAAKARLLACMAAGNIEKTKAAPVTAILASDQRFYDQLPHLFPHADARAWFAGNEELIKTTAFRNSTLQGGYFILAARAFGLDCGPMSGFDQEGVDREFFADSNYKSNFICNLGYGDASKLFPRSPRLEFAEACKVI
jgi:nitroreductase